MIGRFWSWSWMKSFMSDSISSIVIIFNECFVPSVCFVRNHETPPFRKPHKDCKYSQEEMEQILPFKESFIESGTASAHLLIMKSKILPAMFTYWQGLGKEPRDAEEGKAWAKILNVETATTETPGWFTAQTQAAKQVIQQMTPGELKELNNQVIQVGKKGYPTNVQRSLAKKFHAKHIRQVVEEQYKEMGMTSILFIAYTHPDGHMVIDVVDHIADIMGVLIKPFIEAFPDEVKSMKLYFMNYVKLLLKKKKNPLLQLALSTGIISVKLTLETTAEGYPIIPIPIPSTNWNKNQWADLYSQYMQ
ncbi:hypothetical protein CPB84DRAFT_1752522 [Gymnopilus junonius]|uniref:Uncharacterized protein n=1 Tax=Gymnopilus junonius TaxID=109634 RepID=A0A9P5NC44_GYMJU|nr:hypothetical protein CPB84DRAFT_1752522 [Gymnopilus junonius]